jgi:hypothetical protein
MNKFRRLVLLPAVCWLFACGSHAASDKGDAAAGKDTAKVAATAASARAHPTPPIPPMPARR